MVSIYALDGKMIPESATGNVAKMLPIMDLEGQIRYNFEAKPL